MVVFDNLQTARRAKAGKRLRVLMLAPACAKSMARPNTSFTSSGMPFKSRLAEPTHFSGLRDCFVMVAMMSIWAYQCQ
jgi:hypothetical protein